MRFIVDVLRAILRIVALVFGLLGLTSLALEIAVLTAGDGRANQVLGQVWFQHDPLLPLLGSPSIQLVQVFFERKLQIPSIWSPGITTILNWPAWIALLAVGVALLVMASVLFQVTRRRKAHS